MITREKLLDGVHFTAVEGDYKRTRLSVYLSGPASRQTQTATALAPYLLERGTRALPDKILLGRRLLTLYGSTMEADYSQYGASRVIEAFISGADGELLNGGGEVTRERFALLGDLLCDPDVSDGAFREQGVAIEREKLRETIRSIINDKRDYCFRKLTESFYEGDLRALPTDGFESDLDTLGGKNTYEIYRDFIKSCSVEIFYAGRNAAAQKEAALELAKRLSPASAPIARLEAMPKRETVEISEEMDVEQDKLALAFTTGRTLPREDMNALRVACSLLGGTPTSRLFVNVREKKSLCYYITSSASYESGGGAFIECGVDARQVKLAREAILNELETLADKGPTDKEMAELALTYKNIYGAVGDSSRAINSYLFTGVQRVGELVTPETQLKELLAVSADDVKRLLRELHLNTVSRIAAKEGAR